MKPSNIRRALGDEVLIRVAGAIKTALKRPADFCARFGGEEFIIILPDTRKNGAVHVAKQILTAVEDLGIRHDHSNVGFVTVSLGLAWEEKIVSDYESIIKKADKALYQAKTNGKNRYKIFS